MRTYGRIILALSFMIGALLQVSTASAQTYYKCAYTPDNLLYKCWSHTYTSYEVARVSSEVLINGREELRIFFREVRNAGSYDFQIGLNYEPLFDEQLPGAKKIMDRCYVMANNCKAETQHFELIIAYLPDQVPGGSPPETPQEFSDTVWNINLNGAVFGVECKCKD